MASARGLLLALLLAFCVASGLGRNLSWDDKIVMPTEAEEEEDKGEQGTRWAVLIAGSAGYWNYRHQVRRSSLFPLKPTRYLSMWFYWSALV
jgi:hypothetical protein